MSDVYGAQGGTAAATGAQPVRSAKAATYGDRRRREDAQKVVALPRDRTTRPAVPPGTLPGITAPTERPGEPITHGLPSGPGAGPEILSSRGAADDSLYELRALYARFPSRDLARMIALAESEL